MTTPLQTSLNLEIKNPQSGGFLGKTSAELIAELTPAKRAELEAREAAAREKLAAKRKAVKETASSLPSAVLDQETKAITYFKENNEADYLQVVEQVKKLRAERKITYEDLWWGKYTVTMPCGTKKVKMFFPADTKLADTNYNWEAWDGKFQDKAISRSKLWSKAWQEYLEEKKKQWKKLLSESEFNTLISLLLTDKNQEKQILAFMLATWFYGRLVLFDRVWDNYQRAVVCYRLSARRLFGSLYTGSFECSLVHSTFVE